MGHPKRKANPESRQDAGATKGVELEKRQHAAALQKELGLFVVGDSDVAVFHAVGKINNHSDYQPYDQA